MLENTSGTDVKLILQLDFPLKGLKDARAEMCFFTFNVGLFLLPVENKTTLEKVHEEELWGFVFMN